MESDGIIGLENFSSCCSRPHRNAKLKPIATIARKSAHVSEICWTILIPIRERIIVHSPAAACERKRSYFLPQICKKPM
jgi:hypothetical protein